jgi:hypothetical protein
MQDVGNNPVTLAGLVHGAASVVDSVATANLAKWNFVSINSLRIF